MRKPKQRLPPERPWTWPAKFNVVSAAWCFCLAGFDFLAGNGLWAFALGLLAVLNVIGAARMVRSNWEWRQSYMRMVESEKKS